MQLYDKHVSARRVIGEHSRVSTTERRTLVTVGDCCRSPFVYSSTAAVHINISEFKTNFTRETDRYVINGGRPSDLLIMIFLGTYLRIYGVCKNAAVQAWLVRGDRNIMCIYFDRTRSVRKQNTKFRY